MENPLSASLRCGDDTPRSAKIMSNRCCSLRSAASLARQEIFVSDILRHCCRTAWLARLPRYRHGRPALASVWLRPVCSRMAEACPPYPAVRSRYALAFCRLQVTATLHPVALDRVMRDLNDFGFCLGAFALFCFGVCFCFEELCPVSRSPNRQSTFCFFGCFCFCLPIRCFKRNF